MVGGAALALVAIFGLIATTAFAGPIILGGDDLDWHGNYNSGSGPNQRGWLYIEKALASMYRDGCITRPRNDGSIAVLGGPFSNVPNGTSTSGGSAGAAIHFAGNVALTKGVNYYEGVSGINTFFLGLSANTINPAIIYIPSSIATNGISALEGSTLTGYAADLQNFVNSGGGLFAHIDSYNNTGGWVTAVTGVTVSSGICQAIGATLTTAGNAAFPGLTNSDIDSVAGPCHATFSGSLGGLSVLAIDGGSPTSAKRNYIIGGGCGTTLPSAGFVIHKNVSGAPASFAGTFNFHVTCNTPSGGVVQQNVSITLPATSVTVTGVPAGSTCQVTEGPLPAAPTGYSWFGAPSYSPANGVVTLSHAGAGNVTVTNTMRECEDQAEVTIIKNVVGVPATFTGAFTMTLSCFSTTGVLTNHPITLTYPGSLTSVVTGIPAGSVCTLTETGLPAIGSGYQWLAPVYSVPFGQVSCSGVSGCRRTIRVTNTAKYCCEVPPFPPDQTDATGKPHGPETPETPAGTPPRQ